MAEVAVSSVLRKLADMALNKALDLYHVSDQVEQMQLELRLIQCFLRDADSKRNRNPLVKQWVKEVRDLAHKMEDAMDTFLVEIEKTRPKCSTMITKLKRLGKNPLKLAGFCDEVKKIRVTLTMIYERRTHLGITDIGVSSEEHNWVPFRPSKLSDIDVSEVVGLDSEKCQIIGHLLDRSILRRTVLSIVGIGGLGKTTLAQKIYKSAELEGQFHYRIWLSISQKFNLTNLLRETLYSIEPQIQKRESIVLDEDLPTELKRSLSKKRYLIILDDVWTIDLWDRLKIILPDMKNGSRVLITSRSLDVAMAADPEISPHQVSYLTEEDSLALLLRKAFPHKEPNNYPPHLMEVAKQLTRKCGQLPLALIVLGSILSRKERTFSTWYKVEQTMDWHNEEGAKCSQVLAMSYEDLPYHLKPCFLYFASFPEDYKISAKHVTRMWIAEGFIPKDGVGTLEDRAEMYLEELALRCLIQDIEKSWNGNCKYCHMHDLLRDLAIHEAKEENFFTIFSKEKDDSQLDARVARRATLQFFTPTEYGVHSTNIRSLLSFGQYISNYGGFRLLRVLIIERVDMSKKEVAYERWLEGLIHLRYLGFRHCGTMPRGFERVSFSSFKNLETLEFKESSMSLFYEPNHSLWKVPTLRHIISPRQFPFISNPSNWHDLKNLQTLKWVSLPNIPELGYNINLRKMGLLFGSDFWKQCGCVEQAQHMLKGLLKRTELLISLSVFTSLYIPFPIGNTSDLPCYEKIQSLRLYGTWPRDIVLNFEMLPTNLTKFTLSGSKLEQDPMPKLERLQNLRTLQLWIDSYLGTDLICSTGGFPRLQKLELSYLRNLRHWNITEGAMPILRQLKIGRCHKLHILPQLQKVPTLQDLVVHESSYELHRRMQSEDLYKIKHIPFVRTTER